MSNKRKRDQQVEGIKSPVVKKIPITSSSSDQYTFKFKTKKDCDKCIEHIEGNVMLNGVSVGDLSGLVVKRIPGFYSACDSVSSEAQACSVCFFDRTGSIRDDFRSLFHNSCRKGSYLHIENVCVNEAHSGKDLGLRLLRGALEHCQKRNKWSVAFIQPYPLEAKGSFREGALSVSRYFARLGFRQCSSNPADSAHKFWFLESVDFEPGTAFISKEQVQKIEVTLSIEKNELEGPNKILADAISKLAGHPLYDPAIHEIAVKMVRDLLALGADLNASNSLHCAVANSAPNMLLQFLITEGAEINHKDDMGSTPLHVAAGVQPSSRVLHILLGNGANICEKDLGGKTPLKTLEEHIESMKDFCHTFGLQLQSFGNTNSLSELIPLLK